MNIRMSATLGESGSGQVGSDFDSVPASSSCLQLPETDARCLCRLAQQGPS